MRSLCVQIAAIFFIGCGQILGVSDFRIDDKGDSDASIVASCVTAPATETFDYGAFTYRSRECGACVDEQCSAESTACSLDPVCSAFMQCLALCEPCDHQCRGQCTGVAGAYVPPETAALQQCEATNCPDLCNGLLVSFETCDRCVEQECHDALMRASTGGGTEDLTECKTGRLGPCRSRCSTEAIDLGCLEHVVWPKPNTTAATLTLSVSGDDGSGIPVFGLNVEGCFDGSPGCEERPDPPVLGTIAGTLTFSERDPANTFFGYLRATDPTDVYPKHVLYAFPWPSRDASLLARFWTRAALESRLAISNVEQDAMNGWIFADVLDCRGESGAHVPDVSIEIERNGATAADPVPSFFYGYPLVLDPDGHTDDDGLVLIANVAPGRYIVTATTKAGTRFGTVHVWVEADTVTSFHLVPTETGE